MFQVTSDETGRTFSFASELIYEHANQWICDAEKENVEVFCRTHGLELTEPTADPSFRTGRKLADDWQLMAAELWARVPHVA